MEVRQKVKDDFNRLQIAQAQDVEEAAKGVLSAQSALSRALSVGSLSLAQAPAAAACMHQQPHMRDGAVNEGWGQRGRRTRERLFARGTSR